MKFKVEFELTQIEQFKQRELIDSVIEHELKSHIEQALEDYSCDLWVDTTDGEDEFNIYKIKVCR